MFCCWCEGASEISHGGGNENRGRGHTFISRFPSPVESQYQSDSRALHPQRLTERQQRTLHSYFSHHELGVQLSEIQENNTEESSDGDDDVYDDEQFDEDYGMNVDD